ncbi:MAG: hypothetical protein WCB68_20560 [Pyrinomonadaceae bacterium]
MLQDGIFKKTELEKGSPFGLPFPARTPGVLGHLDRSDLNVAACFIAEL